MANSQSQINRQFLAGDTTVEFALLKFIIIVTGSVSKSGVLINLQVYLKFEIMELILVSLIVRMELDLNA
jgi:hypothetical protein